MDKQDFFKKAKEIADKTKEIAAVGTEKAKSTAIVVGNKTQEVALKTGAKTKEKALATKEQVMKKMDINGDGNVDLEDIIILGLKTPGVKVDRTDFFKKEFMKNHTEEQIKDAIEYNPAHASFDKNEINDIADEVINYERMKVSAISAGLGVPGGAAMIATVTADMIQYYGYMLRAAQKLMYLYGFPEIEIDEKKQVFDHETLNILVLCIGAMYGVAGANHAIMGMAKALGTGVQKQLVKKALTKGIIYPIVKSIAKWFNVKMTKAIFTKAIGSSIPVLGAVLSGGLTFFSFKPCCDKLKTSLQDTLLSNPKHVSTKEENIISDALKNDDEIQDVEYKELINEIEEDTEKEIKDDIEDK